MTNNHKKSTTKTKNHQQSPKINNKNQKSPRRRFCFTGENACLPET
jgi:hypothetical protein